MAVYNVSGTELNALYDVESESIYHAYDVEGTEVFGGQVPPVQPMDWTNIPTQYRTNIASAMSYANTYLNSHSNAFMFPVLTDVHDKFYNEPNYLLYNFSNKFDKFLFLGDIANEYSQTEMDNAKAYIQQASSVDVLALVGNHELSTWAEGDDLPKDWYQPLVPSSAVVMSETDALVYYFDDTTNNIRFIVLDSCTPIYKSAGTQLLTKNELEFFASALDMVGGRDVLLLNHAPGQYYYRVAEPETGESTTTVTNRATMDSIINAYINKTSVTLTDDASVSHTHDYSEATGRFIGLVAGHTHRAGYTNSNGYNVLICPSSYYNDSGMSIFIVDPDAKKIIWLIAYKSLTSIGTYEYTYGT